MQWDKKKEESVDVEQEEDGGIIEWEPKQKAKFGRRQILQEECDVILKSGVRCQYTS